MDIYLKPMKKATLTNLSEITIKDICEVLATKDVADTINSVKLIEIDNQSLLNKKKKDQKQSYLVTITDIIKQIKKKYPDASVVNVGEMDTYIEYSPTKSEDNKLYKWSKIAFVCVVLFVGSGIAIMSFYSDAQMSEVFENTHKLIFGQETKHPIALEVAYSIGLTSGIIMFFNHFLGKAITNDPTPIEVEITKYEADVSDTMIDMLDTLKKNKGE